MSPEVTIVIPTRNEEKHITQCLRSVLQQEPPPGGFEVIIADGASTDKTRELVEGFARQDPRVRLIDNPRQIVSSGLNAAIRAAAGSIIVRMDAHTEYAPDYVRNCVEVLRATGADNVGGPARTRAKGYMASAIAAAYHSPFAVGGARFHDPTFEGYLDTVTYGCWHRAHFDKFGLFDEELVRNQDDEHNLRITRGGGKIYQSPKIQSWYSPRSSLSALFRQYMQYGYWKVRVIQKHRIPASIRHLVPGTFVLALLGLGALSLSLGLGYLLLRLANMAAGKGTELLFLGFAGVSAALGLLLSVYFLAALAGSFLTAARSGWRLLPPLPVVFFCYHFSYGLGFLLGFLDFVIGKKGPSRWAGALTRGGTAQQPKSKASA
ncbi:MAG: glycosyltransferase family 2 protein [Verrucomicrobiales bacterium]|nr:glycosyltransferase family 2 protein [Verrucomicrobiales bacterium]